MARMVATKTALSVRVDALSDPDDKSEPTAPSIGVENRAKLESRLRALEHQSDAASVRRFSEGGKKQARFDMQGGTSTYNDAADLVPTQREPMEAAVKAVLDVKEEKRRAKEEKRRLKEEKKARKAAQDDAESEEPMEVDENDGQEKKQKKSKRKDSEEADVTMVSSCSAALSTALTSNRRMRMRPKSRRRPRRRPGRLRRLLPLPPKETQTQRMGRQKRRKRRSPHSTVS